MFMGILGHIAEYDELRPIIARVLAAVPPASYLARYDATNTNPAFVEACEGYVETGGVPYVLRSPEELEACFTGMERVGAGRARVGGHLAVAAEPRRGRQGQDRRQLRRGGGKPVS